MHQLHLSDIEKVNSLDTTSKDEQQWKKLPFLQDLSGKPTE